MSLGFLLIGAGYGSLRRDETGQPVSKLLEEVGEKPMFLWPLFAAQAAGIEKNIMVVNPVYKQNLQTTMNGLNCRFVVQPERRGSADAVLWAVPVMREMGITDVLIAYADMPLWSAETIRTLSHTHVGSRNTVTMVTVDRYGHTSLDRYGRVIHKNQKIKKIVEVDDPAITQEERETQSVNPSLWGWNVRWLEKNIRHVRPVQRGDGYPAELYLPPLIGIAYRSGEYIGEVILENPQEALGVNNEKHLQMVREAHRRLSP